MRGRCRDCDAELVPGGSFCPGCGTPLVDDVTVIDLEPGPDDPGPDQAGSDGATGRARRRGGDGARRLSLGGRFRAWAGVAMVVVAVALAGWWAFGDDGSDGDERSDGEVSDGEVSDGEVSDGEVSDGEVSDGEVSDGEVPDGEVPDGDEGSDDGTDRAASEESRDGGAEAGGDDRSRPGETGERVIVDRAVPEGEPFMGRETGLVAVANVGGRVTVIDLDTSTSTISVLNGDPLGVIDGRLVIGRATGLESVLLADLRRPEIDEVTFDHDDVTDTYDQVVPDNDSGLVWVHQLITRSLTVTAGWTGIDPATGAVVRSEGYDAEDPRDVPFPGLRWTADGTLWRMADDGGHEAVAGGVVAGTDGDLALLFECEAPFECGPVWRDVATGRRRDDLAVPPGAPDRVRIIDGTVVLWVTGNESSLWDVETGEPLFTGLPLTGLSPVVGIDVSADGRYLAVPNVDGDPVLHDRETGETFSLRPLLGGTSALLLLDRASVGDPS